DAMPAYTGYDPSVNPSIATEFSTVGFRFGHSLLNDTVARDANNGSSLGTVQLAQDFFDPNLINTTGAIDPLTNIASADIGAYLKGDADNSAQAMDVMAVSDIRNLLFGNGPPGSPTGEDLISRDIWRAHDDGIGTYNQVRSYYDTIFHNLPPITNDATQGFDQITSNVQVQQELAAAYNSKAGFQANGKTAGDIDPFIAGLAEDHVPGSDLGPLFTDILVDQFTRLETGDRYFYLNESFTPAEQAILSQGSTLGQIITANTGVTNLQSDVFLNPQLSQQNATGKGFFGNKNGEAALTGSTTGTTLTASIYNGLIAALDPKGTGTTVLVDANGNNVSDTFLQSYGNVQSFLQSATGSNMANMLSAQLLTTELNVLLGQVNPTTSIFTPVVSTLTPTLQNSLVTNNVSTASGVANIQNILDASIAQLLADANGSSDATFDEALKDCLDAINKNEIIFIV
ncbi:MAG TPA: peroxidase family protein, partial [Gemmataceae bacterium]